MGLLQKALETYDAMERLAGIYEEGKEPLAPIGHIVTKAQIEVTIDTDGQFISARAADKDKKIIIPATERSGGRSGTAIAPHPLCDKLDYLSGQTPEKLDAYLLQLKAWVDSDHSHPKAAAVLHYMEKRTLRTDLLAAGLATEKEKDGVICWRIVGCGVENGSAVWEDISLMKAYTAWYLSQQKSEKQLCMLTGKKDFITWKHLGGVFSLNGIAKIISANDSANFTYRGRFAEPKEAASVGYLASQKAHNALKWLISTQGAIQGNRAFVAWNPKGKHIPKPTLPLFTFTEDAAPTPTYRSYQADLRNKLEGYRAELEVSDQVVIAAFDAATTGRLAITYYNELLGSDFLDRLAHWEETCCWAYNAHSISSPSLFSIVTFAFGTPRGRPEVVKADDAIIAGNMQHLLACRIDQAAFPLDIMKAIVTRAGNMQVYDYETNRSKLLYTACAVIRKYHIDHKKEEFSLALEPERKDRSYQWGRLLAVMEKIERDTYDADEKKREPNAIRLQSVFVQRPGYAAKIIMDQLKTAYYPRLPVGSRIYYDRLIGEIMEQLSHLDAADYNKPLTETYLPGYYLQKNVFYTKKADEETEEE